MTFFLLWIIKQKALKENVFEHIMKVSGFQCCLFNIDFHCIDNTAEKNIKTYYILNHAGLQKLKDNQMITMFILGWTIPLITSKFQL